MKTLKRPKSAKPDNYKREDLYQSEPIIPLKTRIISEKEYGRLMEGCSVMHRMRSAIGCGDSRTSLEAVQRCYDLFFDSKEYHELLEEEGNLEKKHKKTEAKLKRCIENLIAIMETAIYYGDWEVDEAFNPKTDLASAKGLVNLPKDSLNLYEHPKTAK